MLVRQSNILYCNMMNLCWDLNLKNHERWYVKHLSTVSFKNCTFHLVEIQFFFWSFQKFVLIFRDFQQIHASFWLDQLINLKYFWNWEKCSWWKINLSQVAVISLSIFEIILTFFFILRKSIHTEITLWRNQVNSSDVPWWWTNI